MAPIDDGNGQTQKTSTRKRWSRKKNKKFSNGLNDTEDRARAWFKAYANWINYQPPEEIDSSSVSEANCLR